MVVAPGETCKEAPVPIGEPPHDPVYHCHTAPVPREPPITVNVVVSPIQIVSELAEADAGSVE